MEYKLYVHIGSNDFDKRLFRDISNINHFVKPMGGLWGSPVDSDYGWEDWVISNDFNNTIGFNKYGKDRFYFKLKDNSKLLYIDNAKCLKDLPQINDDLFQIAKSYVQLDFEMLKNMYDAIEVNISADNQLYWDLYGWDVDSILVLNPDCVEVVDKDK